MRQERDTMGYIPVVKIRVLGGRRKLGLFAFFCRRDAIGLNVGDSPLFLVFFFFCGSELKGVDVV
jgi:hypothetical protein